MERLSPSPKFQPIKFAHSRETKSITLERWIQLQVEPLQAALGALGADRIFFLLTILRIIWGSGVWEDDLQIAGCLSAQLL
jgi:hypothetical protein